MWFWFPDYLFTALSSFAFITWIVPNNQKVNAIFGVRPLSPTLPPVERQPSRRTEDLTFLPPQMNSGLGLLPISFDWTQISYAGQPLTTPFYVSANCWAAVALFYLVIGPII